MSEHEKGEGFGHAPSERDLDDQAILSELDAPPIDEAWRDEVLEIEEYALAVGSLIPQTRFRKFMEKIRFLGTSTLSPYGLVAHRDKHALRQLNVIPEQK